VHLWYARLTRNGAGVKRGVNPSTSITSAPRHLQLINSLIDPQRVLSEDDAARWIEHDRRLTTQADVDAEFRRDVADSRRRRFGQGVATPCALLFAIAIAIVLSATSVIASARHVDPVIAIQIIWHSARALAHDALPADQAVSLSSTAFVVIAALNVALAVTGRFDGRAAVEDTMWREALGRVASFTAVASLFVVVMYCVGDDHRRLGTVAALVALAGGCIYLAITASRFPGLVTRARLYECAVKNLRELQAWRDRIELPCADEVTTTLRHRRAALRYLLPACGVTLVVMLAQLMIGLTAAKWWGIVLILGVLTLVTAFAAAVAASLIASQWSTVPPAGRAGMWSWRMGDWLLRVCPAFLGLYVILSFFVPWDVRFSLVPFTTASVGPGIVVGAAYWSRKPVCPGFISAMAAPIWVRVHVKLHTLGVEYAKRAERQLNWTD
jgi:hypothetical protein